MVDVQKTQSTQNTQARSQEEIFRSYNWWDKSCLLFQITKERCDYIESRVNAVFGKNALAQQEILEVGSGGGLICEELARRKAVAYGIDPSEGALEAARKHVEQAHLGQSVFFLHGYAESIPYADGSFSVIVCLDVLEHVNNLRATLQEIERVLAPGGIFIFDTINRTLLSRLVLLWLGEGILGKRFPTIGLVPGLHNYHQFIKPGELRHALTASGLQVREMTGFTPHGFDLKNGRLILGPGGPKTVSYVGYATKDR